MDSNATDIALAGALAEIGDLGQGTLASLQIHKKGLTRGKVGSQTTYDDDFVHTLIWTGFHYQALVKRSHKKLHVLWASGTFVTDLLQATRQLGHEEVTVQDAASAIQEINEGFIKIMAGTDPEDLEGGAPAPPPREEWDATGEPLLRKPVWEPLKVDGHIVKGTKVYIGDSAESGIPQGTVYIDGVKLGEKILAPAPNGYWTPKQKAKTVVKDLIRAKLPCGLYVRYCLSPANLLVIKVGAEASEHSRAGGIQIDPEAIRSLFKIAA